MHWGRDAFWSSRSSERINHPSANRRSPADGRFSRSMDGPVAPCCQPLHGSMTQTLLQGTSLLTSRLGMGTAALHHLSTERARQSLLAAALYAGITHFDTAPMYGEGLAERSLGQFLRGRIRSEDGRHKSRISCTAIRSINSCADVSQQGF